MPIFICFLLAFSNIHVQEGSQESEISPIPRRLPPVGESLAADVSETLETELAKLERELEESDPNPALADAAVYAKAVRLALTHDEFYSKNDVKAAQQLLTEGNNRLAAIQSGEIEWEKKRGTLVRGFYSAIDGSPQPIGLEIPEDLDLSKPVPVYVWLHGRGDKTTDLHFIQQRSSRPGQLKISDGIILHPFGRQCVGFKSAGEIDVLEAVAWLKQNYNVDPDRIALLGFSMGGAGVWHLGAHYPYLWTCVCPGAGFAETAQYNRLKEADFPPAYTQKLWGHYDVPDYTRNLFNVPTLAYSGEEDRQIQAARVMESAFAAEGRELAHEIGPGMGHRYHPDSLARITKFAQRNQSEGLPSKRTEFYLQTKTLRYPRAPGVLALHLESHWDSAQITGKVVGEKLIIETENVNRFQLLDSFAEWPVNQIEIDGELVSDQKHDTRLRIFQKHDNTWLTSSSAEKDGRLVKEPSLQGPIDDAFMSPFMFVLPSSSGDNSRVDAWVEFESAHQIDRWRALMRGEPRVKLDVDVTPEDARQYNLILWGTPASNQYLRRSLASLPITWDSNQLTLNESKYDSDTHVPVLIFPNSQASGRYIVLNSGLTFREAHDRTNSQQNPKLPDWAVLDITEDPNAESAGRVIAADFFDENWGFKTGTN